MSDLPVQANENLADAALENLVNQFARPLDFLRELVQNAIDAGTPRVEVWLRYVDAAGGKEHGVLEIHVDDFGEGMDETVIDNHLTRLFSSTKEDDLTKIGKFGIGFTSIFAIQPDAVLLRTSRHGESWELLFHPDRSFDKVRSDKLVDGTKITLFKRLPRTQVEAYVHDARWILSWWCEHSNTPITFWDRTTEQKEETSEPSADPFAAFENPDSTPSGPLRINSPLALPSATLSARRERDGVEALVGYDSEGRFGYYNGGLTLVNTRNPDVLGSFTWRMRHLTFKLKYDRLEHTLTRDNVLHDAHWVKAMSVLFEASEDLRDKLVERAVQAVTEGEELSHWHGLLAQECSVTQGAETFWDRYAGFPLFRDRNGRPLSLREIEEQEDDQGAVLLDTREKALAQALGAEGIHLVEDTPATRELLLACWRPPVFSFLGEGRRLATAEDVYVLPDEVNEVRMTGHERRLVMATRELLGEAVGDRITLRVGEYGGPERAAQRVLVQEGPPDGKVFQRPEAAWVPIPALFLARCLLVNRYHPFFQLQVTAAAEDLTLAAYSLAQALLHTEDLEGDRPYLHLLEAAGEDG